MPFTNLWDVTFPADTELANLIGANLRQLRVDTQQRMASISGLDANKPAFGSDTQPANWNGVLFWATDTGKVYQFNNPNWTDVTASIKGVVWGAITGNVLNQPDVAPSASPAFTGTPTAPTPATADSSLKLATTAFVTNVLANGYAASFANPGYIKFPLAFGNLIMQWSKGSPTANTISVNFPIPFTTSVLLTLGTTQTGTQTFSVTNTGLTAWSLTGNGTYWLFAIGV